MKYLSNPIVYSNPNPRAPLSAVIEFETDVLSRATISVTAEGRNWDIKTPKKFVRLHRIPLVGVHPGERCEIAIQAEDERGQFVGAPQAISIVGNAVPEDIPPIEVKVCRPEQREPGVILFNVRPSPASEDSLDFGVIIGVDQEGEIVWLYKNDTAIGDVRVKQNGNILFVSDGLISEIDLLGNTVQEWYAVERWREKTPPADAIAVQTVMFHHSAIELPSGNILACSMEIREVEDFPASEDDPDAGTETAKVVGDVIIEFEPDGNIVNEYRLLDIIDPRRVCYGSRAGYWVRRGFPDTYDWSHVNGLAYDSKRGSIVASVRHQDCIISIKRDNGELEWILGDPANWCSPWSDNLLAPLGDLEWQYHQHDCTITTSGTVMCFDNGNHRALPFDEKMPEADCYSRAVEFFINSERQTVEQVWSRGLIEDGTYSTYQSGAVRLPRTGNTFINYGGVCTLDGVPSGQINKGHCKARLIEVTPGPSGEIVFELEINDTSTVGPIALSSFRAEYYSDFLTNRG